MPLISLVGSDRPKSFNASAVSLVESALQSLGEDTHRVGWENLDLPIYSQVIESEQGLPDAITELRAKLAGADGLIIGCPEYNVLCRRCSSTR